MGVMTKEDIQAAVADCEDITVEHADDKGIEDWDDLDAKVIRFRFLEEFCIEDLAELISISKDIPEKYQVDKNVLAGYLWEACVRNAFITLEELVVIWSEPGDPETFEPAVIPAGLFTGLYEKQGLDEQIEDASGIVVETDSNDSRKRELPER